MLQQANKEAKQKEAEEQRNCSHKYHHQEWYRAMVPPMRTEAILLPRMIVAGNTGILSQEQIGKEHHIPCSTSSESASYCHAGCYKCFFGWQQMSGGTEPLVCNISHFFINSFWHCNCSLVVVCTSQFQDTTS